jgi:hypothetical protein
MKSSWNQAPWTERIPCQVLQFLRFAMKRILKFGFRKRLANSLGLDFSGCLSTLTKIAQCLICLKNNFMVPTNCCWRMIGLLILH